MIWIVSLPFAALAAALIVIRVLRGVRQFQEIQATRDPLGPIPAHRKSSDVYHDERWLPLCERLAEAAAQGLNRPLTRNERRAIWRGRSELVIEIALSEVQAATHPHAVSDVLATMPTGIDRPDPTDWSHAG
jgi:hypothetical protein